jgi:hypothetical protein
MLSEAAAAFIYRKHKLFIGGEWTDSFSAREMEVIDPATGALLTHCPATNQSARLNISILEIGPFRPNYRLLVPNIWSNNLYFSM